MPTTTTATTTTQTRVAKTKAVSMQILSATVTNYANDPDYLKVLRHASCVAPTVILSSSDKPLLLRIKKHMHASCCCHACTLYV